MSDYISKEKAMHVVINAVEDLLDNDMVWGAIRDTACDFINDRIKNVKPADTELVRHARWEPGNPICPVCGEDKFKDLDADIWSDWTPPYCPNCGTKMDLEDCNGKV